MEAEERRKRQRVAAERWKQANYEYYLIQKRGLSTRPSYRAHRRQKYREKQITLRASEGYVPPVRGRPRIYSPCQARQRRRDTARTWASTRRAKEKISGKENYQQDVNTTPTTSEESHRRRHSSGGATQSRQERRRSEPGHSRCEVPGDLWQERSHACG